MMWMLIILEKKIPVFTHNDKKIILNFAKPSMPKPIKGDKNSLQPPNPKSCHTLSHKKFETESRESEIMLAVLSRNEIQLILDFQDNPPPEIEQLKEEFKNVISEDIPDDLPSIRDSQHAIKLIPRSQISNISHYRLNHKEREKTRK